MSISLARYMHGVRCLLKHIIIKSTAHNNIFHASVHHVDAMPLIVVLLANTLSDFYSGRHGTSCGRSSTAHEHARVFEPDVVGSSRTGIGGASGTCGADSARNLSTGLSTHDGLGNQRLSTERKNTFLLYGICHLPLARSPQGTVRSLGSFFDVSGVTVRKK